VARNCKACGRETTSGKFCPYCGTPIADGAAAEPPASSPPPQPVPAGTPIPHGAPYPGVPQYAPSTPPPAPKYKGTRKSGLARLCGLLGVAAAAGAIAGSLMPWIVVTGLGTTFGGWDKDGRITVFVAGAALLFFFTGLVTIARWPFVVAGLASVGCLAIFIVDMLDVGRLTSAYASIGAGLWVGAACSGAMVLIAVVGIAAPRKKKI
jgi:hypothetical protein